MSPSELQDLKANLHPDRHDDLEELCMRYWEAHVAQKEAEVDAQANDKPANSDAEHWSAALQWVAFWVGVAAIVCTALIKGQPLP